VTIIKNIAMCGIGSGITWDSNPTDEYAEGQIKQRFLWRATANFELLETLRLEDGRLWLVSHHEERLRRSAAYFGFIYDAAAVRQKLDGLAEQNPKGLYRVRLLVDRRGNAKTEIYPMAAPGARSKDDYCFTSDVVRVCMAERPIDSDNEFLRHKTTNRGIYDAFAPKDPGIFDTLLYNERDEITEFTRGNVAVGFNGKLVTPPESCGLLPGTLRAELLAKGILSEHVITRGDLRDVNALWFLNSLRGMIPARL
jgi:para-aminobenzoate synthetase/4-amino-4-deoxychorismate lyase